MDKKLDKIQKSLEIFKELHYKNSKEYRDGSRIYRELVPIGGYDERYNKSFEEVKEELDKIPKDEKGESFIVYFSNRFVFFPGGRARSREPKLKKICWNFKR